MSQEIREKALSAAVALGGDPATVVAAAQAFEAFLGGASSAAKPADPKPAATKPAATKPATTPATKPAATKPAAKPAPKKDEVDPDAKKMVGDKVNELLKANKRDEVIALLASFDGAQSATGIVALGDEVIEAFMAGAEEILASSEGGLAD